MNYLDFHFEDIEVPGDLFATGYAEVEYEIEPADRSVGYDGDVDFTVTSITATLVNENGDASKVVLKKGDDLFDYLCKLLSRDIGNECWDTYHGEF
jgi:hypothetical protein